MDSFDENLQKIFQNQQPYCIRQLSFLALNNLISSSISAMVSIESVIPAGPPSVCRNTQVDVRSGTETVDGFKDAG